MFKLLIDNIAILIGAPVTDFINIYFMEYEFFGSLRLP